MNTEYWQQWAQAAKKREAELETELTQLRAAITEFAEADSEISPSKSVSDAEHRQVVARWDAAIKALHEQAAKAAKGKP